MRKSLLKIWAIMELIWLFVPNGHSPVGDNLSEC